MSVLSEETAGQSLATAVAAPIDPSHDVGLVSIAAVTSRVEYTGPLDSDNPEGARHYSSLAAQWVRQLIACYPTQTPKSLASPITPDTLIPVMFWSTTSTYQNGTENVDLVPLWMLASGEEAFLRTHLSIPPDNGELETTLLGSEQAPYRWHMKVFWGDAQSAAAFSDDSRKLLEAAVSPDILGALAGLNDGLLEAIKQGMPRSYEGFAGLEAGMDCASLTTDTSIGPRRELKSLFDEPLKPISLLPGGVVFRPHKFAGQWLSERGLSSDATVRVNYQEVDTIDSASESTSAWVPLRHAVTQGFLSAYQSKDDFSPSTVSAREGWRYPHRNQMSLDFSSLKINGQPLTPDLLQQLQTGVPAGYQGPGRALITEVDGQGNLLGFQEKGQIRQFDLLDANQVKLAILFAGIPTFDTALKNLLVHKLKEKFEVRQFRAALLERIDPDTCYVNHFATDSSGGRSLTSSESFTDVMAGCLRHDAPPDYSLGDVGFFTRPDSVEEDDSVFADPVDVQVLRAMESVFYIAHPTTNELVRNQLRDDLASFPNSWTWLDSLDPSSPAIAEAALAYLLAQRFLHLFNLYRFDQTPVTQLTQSARNLQDDENRLLELITTHPSMADRSRLLRAPVPHVYAVMLDMGSATAQKWPAAMVIKVPDRRSLFLYSLEGGIQRFDSFSTLVKNVRPIHEGQERTIRDIATELSEHAFEVAAKDLLHMQRTAFEAVLKVPDDQALTLELFAQGIEDAFVLPMLSLSGPLDIRQRTLVENHRPNLYKTATQAQKQQYRLLEEQALQAAIDVSKPIPSLWAFTRQKVREYMQQTLHPGIDFDPDKTLVTLASGNEPNPTKSRTTNLTQWMLDNLRVRQYPNEMRNVQAIYLADDDGRRVRNPANGYFVTLTGLELAKATISIDAGGNYAPVLEEALNKPDYKAAWQAAYQANMRFKGYEAALRGDETFKTIVRDQAFTPPKPYKQVALWLDVVLKSPTARTRAEVEGKKVHVHALVLEGIVGAGRRDGSVITASIEGALIFSDQQGLDIKGTVGAYFPDSPDGNDFHEFSDLGSGVAALLLREEWQKYFRSRISLAEPEQIKWILGQRNGPPSIRNSLIDGDYLENLYRAHVSFHKAHAAERYATNQQVRNDFTDLFPVIVLGVVEMVTLLIPGFQLLKRAMKTGWAIFRTGLVPRSYGALKLLHRLENHGGSSLTRGAAVPSRGQSSFLAVTSRQSQAEASRGLPLEKAVYSRYAVADASVVQGAAPDAQGFYRLTLKDPGTGRVTARPVYIQQRDGTVFRVHDHTSLNATEANIVDPVTGLSIRSSAVMRSTVARMPDGNWRAVGYGRGGGKRPAPSLPGSSVSKVPARLPSTVSQWVRTPGIWNNQIMDLVPSFITRLSIWPQNRSLLIIDEIAATRGWSVRYSPGQIDRIHPQISHPSRLDSDVVLKRTGQNHFSLIQHDHVVSFPADGDCFFNAVAYGLYAGWTENIFSVQQLRNAAADHIDQHPQISNFLVPRASLSEQALFDSGPKTVWNGNWQPLEGGKIQPFALRYSNHAMTFRFEPGTWSSRNPYYPFIWSKGTRPKYDSLLAKASPSLRAETHVGNIKGKVEAFTQWGMKLELSSLAFFRLPGHVATEVKELTGGLVGDLVNLKKNGQAVIQRIIEPMAGSGYYSNYARAVGFQGEMKVNDINPLISWAQSEIVKQPDRVKYYIDFIKKDMVSMGKKDGFVFDPDNLTLIFKSAQEAKAFANSEAVRIFRDKVRNYFNEVVDVVIQIKDGDVVLRPPGAKGTYVIARPEGDSVVVSAPPPNSEDKAFLAAAYYILQNNSQSGIVSIKALGDGRYSLHLPVFLMAKDFNKVHLFRSGLANTNHLNYISHLHQSAMRPTGFTNKDGWALLDELVDNSDLSKNKGDLIILSGHFSDVYLPEQAFMQKIRDHVLPLSNKGAMVIVTNAYSPGKEAAFRALGFHTFRKARPAEARSDYLLAINKPAMQAAQNVGQV